MYNTNYQELYHHGILGQKWGIRRFQNEDGSLTPAGRKRYADAIANEMNGYSYKSQQEWDAIKSKYESERSKAIQDMKDLIKNKNYKTVDEADNDPDFIKLQNKEDFLYNQYYDASKGQIYSKYAEKKVSSLLKKDSFNKKRIVVGSAFVGAALSAGTISYMKSKTRK